MNKKRNEISLKYCWNIEFLLENKTYEENIQEFKNIFNQLIKINLNRYNSSSLYLESLKLEDKLTLKYYKISNYLQSLVHQNLIDAKSNQKLTEFQFLNYQLDNKMGAQNYYFFLNADKIQKYIQNSEFINYKKYILNKLEEKKYQLSKEIQIFQNISSRAEIDVNKIFNILSNSELFFQDIIDSQGKKIKASLPVIQKLFKNKDALVRKNAFLSLSKAFLDHKNTFANLLYEHFKKITTWSKIYKFNNVIESLIFPDRLKEKFLLTLYKSVQKNKKIFIKYETYFKKFYQIKFNKKITKYDWSVELVNIKNKFTIIEAKKIILESVKPFGKEYVLIVNKAFNDNWIDFLPNKNKISGAYSISNTYGIDKKLILMNFNYDMRSLETLIHELGHSLHSYFVDKNNVLKNSDYPIFLAEIASIFNELILFDYLMTSSEDPKFHFFILQKIINNFKSTVLKQTEWSNYEYDLYKAIEKGAPVSTFKDISSIYFENHKKYTNKKNLKYNEEDLIASIYVPHYYYNFYVYKYAIGKICALIFFQKYKKEGPKALQDYINNFLIKSSRDWPLKILQNVGIDLNNDSIYEYAFIQMDEYIKKWISLGKKIFKIKK